MFANFFRARKDKKKAPVRASFRPTLESLEERAAPASLAFTGSTGGQAYGSQAAGGQASAAQAAVYMRALATASPTQLATIENDVVTAWTSGTQLMAAANGKNSTINVNAQLTTYITAVTDLFLQMNTLVQASSSSANSTSSSGTGYSLLSGGASSASQSGQSNTNMPLQYGFSSLVQPSGSGLYVA